MFHHNPICRTSSTVRLWRSTAASTRARPASLWSTFGSRRACCRRPGFRNWSRPTSTPTKAWRFSSRGRLPSLAGCADICTTLAVPVPCSIRHAFDTTWRPLTRRCGISREVAIPAQFCHQCAELAGRALAGRRRAQTFLEPQGIRLVRVILFVAAELLIAGLAIARDRARIVLMHLEA